MSAGEVVPAHAVKTHHAGALRYLGPLDLDGDLGI